MPLPEAFVCEEGWGRNCRLSEAPPAPNNAKPRIVILCLPFIPLVARLPAVVVGGAVTLTARTSDVRLAKYGQR